MTALTYLSLFSGIGGLDLGNAVVPGVGEFIGRLIAGRAAA